MLIVNRVCLHQHSESMWVATIVLSVVSPIQEICGRLGFLFLSPPYQVIWKLVLQYHCYA